MIDVEMLTYIPKVYNSYINPVAEVFIYCIRLGIFVIITDEYFMQVCKHPNPTK